MPRGSSYCSAESDLCNGDQLFLERYREWEETLRLQDISPFGSASSVSEHKRTIKDKGIAIATQEEFMKELMRYHGWAVLDREICAHHVSLIELLTSYDDLFHYGEWLEQERGVKLWTMNKICQSILRMIKFMKTKERVSNKSELDDMMENVRKLYANISRSAQISLNERPSICEKREIGEALSFLDIVKCHEAQVWRVKVLSNFNKRSNVSLELKKTVRTLLVKEVEKLAILQTLLRYPTRKVETQRSAVVKVGETWRLKLSAMDRKRGRFPINVKLSP